MLATNQLRINKERLYREAERLGASYVANVIVMQHHSPTRKLAGLVALLQAGHEVSVQQFDIEKLTIDGRNGFSFKVLDECANGDTSAIARRPV